MNSILDSPNPRRLMSLASRINAIHRALTAEELAELLQMSRITILRRAKRGSNTFVSSRFLRQIRLCCNRQVANATGRAIHVEGLSRRDAASLQGCGSSSDFERVHDDLWQESCCPR
jgi:predicted DNA-binding transcriptional regulator AlpA